MAAEDPAEHNGAPEDQRQESDVELALHRHRPDVLQRTDGLAGAQIVRRGVGQLPVLVVTQARQTLVGECLPTGFGLDEDRQHRRSREHDHQCGQQPTNQAGDLRDRPQRCARRHRGAQHASAEEEPRQREENVHTPGNAAEPHVEHRDEQDRDAAQAVEVVPVVIRRACSLESTRFARRGSRRRWLVPAGEGRWSSWSTDNLPKVPALTPAEIGAIDAAHVWHPYSTIGASEALRARSSH